MLFVSIPYIIFTVPHSGTFRILQVRIEEICFAKYVPVRILAHIFIGHKN